MRTQERLVDQVAHEAANEGHNLASHQLDTLLLQDYVARYQAGDATAADQLLRAVGARLESLASRMLRDFPNVRAWTETTDVLQSSILRLLNTLRNLQPASTRHFFNLIALHIRRELLDLARSCAKRRETASAHDSQDSQTPGLSQAPDPRCEEVEELELWSRFHETVEQLPLEEREVLSLCFYHGWTQKQIAELLQLSERTVRQRWQSACQQLNRLLLGKLPSL